MVSYQKVAQDIAQAGLMRMTAAIVVILPAVTLLHVLATRGDYRQPAVVLTVWLAVIGTDAWLVQRLRGGRLGTGGGVAAILIAVTVVTVTGVLLRPESPPGSVDLAMLGTVGLLVLVVMSCSPRLWIPGALIVFVTHGALLVRDRGLNPLSLSEAEAAGYIIAAVLIAFATLRPALITHASMAARRVSIASRMAAERAAAAAVQQERQARLAVLEKDALPLLRGIADGTLDPATDDVRDQCARHAAVLRHSLAEHVTGAGDLVSGLEPAVRAARTRGLLVNVQLIGDPGTPQPRVVRAVLATVEAVLGALPPHQVTLTVLAAGDDVEMYLPFGVPPLSTPDLSRSGLGLPAAVCWHATVSDAGTGPGCLEISWRKHGAA